MTNPTTADLLARASAEAQQDHARASAILRGLKAKLDLHLAAARELQQAYIDAHTALAEAKLPSLETAQRAMLKALHDRALTQEDPDAAYEAAKEELPPLRRAIEEAQEYALGRQRDQVAEAHAQAREDHDRD